jgi:hypothetical protein
MNSPTALRASLLFFVAAVHAKTEGVGWYAVLSRLRTSSSKGLIYPANGRQSLAFSGTLKNLANAPRARPIS